MNIKIYYQDCSFIEKYSTSGPDIPVIHTMSDLLSDEKNLFLLEGLSSIDIDTSEWSTRLIGYLNEQDIGVFSFFSLCPGCGIIIHSQESDIDFLRQGLFLNSINTINQEEIIEVFASKETKGFLLTQDPEIQGRYYYEITPELTLDVYISTKD